MSVQTTIVPTITVETDDLEAYNKQMKQVAHFATRVHIDLMDGEFTPDKNISPDEIWWPGGVRADIHVMHRRPFDHFELFLDLMPEMIIVHAEAEGNFVSFAEEAHRRGVEVGVALLPQTSPELIRPVLDLIDHVLIFSGNLGHFGGQADLRMLTKIKHLQNVAPRIELGWDGGVNEHNAKALSMSGVQVLNVGGFIHNAEDPEKAYDQLRDIVI
jgi:ribulose-phosphate 3-epimerase